MTSRTFDMLTTAWTFCGPEDRDAFIAYLRVCGVIPSEQRENVPSQHEVRPGSTSLGIEQQCDTLGVTAGETASNSPSDGDAFAAVTLNEQLANAAGVEPPPSDEKPATLSRQADRAGEATPPASPATQSKADMIRRIRPHCQHLDDLSKCGGSGREHCGPCKRLMAEREAA